MVIRAEDIPLGIYYVKAGFVKMNSLLEDGRELTVNIFKKGSYFPMTWAISNIPNTYFYQSMSADVQLQRAPKEKFLPFLKKNPDVLFEFCNRILIGLNALITNVEYVLSGNAHNRVAAALLLLANRFGEKLGNNNSILIKLPLTHQDIASIAGITRETTSIVMKQIERKKIISHKGKFIIIKSLSDLKKESLLQKKEDGSPLTA